MNFQHPILLTVIGLLARPCMAQLKCFEHQDLIAQDCRNALSQIHYEQGDILFPDSSSVKKATGTCSVVVTKPMGSTLTKRQVGDAVQTILDHCPSSRSGELPMATAGNGVQLFVSLINPGDWNNANAAGNDPYQPIYHWETIRCREDFKLPYNPPDCQTAYQQMKVSNDRFVSTQISNRRSDKGGKEPMVVNEISNTYGTCEVAIVTTDDSPLTVSKKKVDHVFPQLLSHCGGKFAIVNVEGGTASMNGFTLVKLIRHNKRSTNDTDNAD